jgi:hypothetical protein
MNISKASEFLQMPDETPRQFYEQLCEAFYLYTPFDLEATENHCTAPRGHKAKIVETGRICRNEHQPASGGGHKCFSQSRSRG